MGQALMKLRAHLLQAQIASSRTEIGDAKSIIPTDQEVISSELLVGGNSNQLLNGDLHLAAQLFMPKSNEQQAALFGNSVMGSILPTDQMDVPLAVSKAPLVANGATFIGEKRVRPTADQGPQNAKRSSAVTTKLTPCVTCIQMRGDDCTVCKTCCACCLCIPRKNFVPTHVYAGSVAEGQMSSEQSNHEVASSGCRGLAGYSVCAMRTRLCAYSGRSGCYTFADDEDFYDGPGSQPGSGSACDGYKCGDCGAEFISTENREDHNCAASGDTAVHPPVTPFSGSPSSQLSDAPVAQPSPWPSGAPSAQLSDEQGVQPDAQLSVVPTVSEPIALVEPDNSDSVSEVPVWEVGSDADVPMCTYQVVYGQLADRAPTCNVGKRPIAMDGVLVSSHADHTVSHWATTVDGARQNPDHVICERCGKFFDLETLLQHACSMDTVEMMHRLPTSGISNPPMSLPLVNSEIALVHSVKVTQ